MNFFAKRKKSHNERIETLKLPLQTTTPHNVCGQSLEYAAGSNTRSFSNPAKNPIQTKRENDAKKQIVPTTSGGEKNLTYYAIAPGTGSNFIIPRYSRTLVPEKRHYR